MDEYIKSALNGLAKKWSMDPRIREMILGQREARDTAVEVKGIVFHIPTLDNSYVLWKCLWPECHNCCEKQGRLPLTIHDIESISGKLNSTKNDFIEKETRISTWTENEPFGSVSTTLSMISLKRREDERDEQDGTPLTCRFLDGEGYCKLHPHRPGCCQMYPFTSWTTISNGKPQMHATFQFDGNCPGFYISKSIEEMAEVLEDYAKRVYDYNMAVNRTTREGYGFISIVDLR
jgi:hypothetical protein